TVFPHVFQDSLRSCLPVGTLTLRSHGESIDDRLWMRLADLGQEIVEEDSDRPVGRMDPSNDLRDDREPGVDETAVDPGTHRLIHLRIAPVLEPELQEAEDVRIPLIRDLLQEDGMEEPLDGRDD